MIQNSNAGTGLVGHLDSIKTCARFADARTDCPNLARWQRIGLDSLVGLKLRCCDEDLHSVRSECVAEIGVAELALKDSFLLLLDPAPALQRKLDDPLQVFIREGRMRIRVKKLYKPADRLTDGFDIAPGKRSSEMDAAIENVDPRRTPKRVKASDGKSETRLKWSVKCFRGPSFGKSHPGGVQPIHERGVVAHLCGQGR
jgi:hypothetical protein